MLEDIKAIREKVEILISWIADMRTIIQNPYTNGINMPKVLEDLGNYAADLNKSVYTLEEKAKQENLEPQPDEPDNVTVETEKAQDGIIEQ